MSIGMMLLVGGRHRAGAQAFNPSLVPGDTQHGVLQPGYYLKECGNGPVVCISYFGLYRPTDNGGSRRVDVERTLKIIVDNLDNRRSAVLKDQRAIALRQILDDMDNEDVAFWVVAYNPSNTAYKARFYMTVSSTPAFSQTMFNPAQPQFGFGYITDLFVRRYSSRLFDYLQKNHEPLSKHEIELGPGEVKVQGMIPAKRDNAGVEDWYPVALFDGSAADDFNLDKRHMLQIGVIRLY